MYLMAGILSILLDVTPASIWNKSNVDFSKHFNGLTGCFLLQELDSPNAIAWGGDQCQKRLPPCSTFKILNSLIALETGVLKDEDSSFKWDGQRRAIEAWNRDQTLASAMKESVVWYFQRVAREIGPERMKAKLEEVGYGNRNISAGIDQFWLGDGSLEISAQEQLEFVKKLYRNELPFRQGVVKIVKSILVQSEEEGAILSGKTGSKRDGTLGWFVGHLKRGGREYVFATNVTGKSDLTGRLAKAKTQAILNDLGFYMRRPK